MRYLYSGDESNSPAALRIGEVLELLGHLVAGRARSPDQCSHRPVSFSALVRSWKGVVRIIAGLALSAGGHDSRCWTLAQYRLVCAQMAATVRPTERREAIVDAALAVARRKGLGATTVRDVAAEMGTSSGLIHHYFELDGRRARGGVRAGRRARTSAIGRARWSPRPGSRRRRSRRSSGPTRPRTPTGRSSCGSTRGPRPPRRPAVQATSRRLNLAWQALLERDDRRRRGARRVPMRRPRGRGVADPVARRRPGTPGRRPRDDGPPRRRPGWTLAAAERELGLPGGVLTQEGVASPHAHGRVAAHRRR